MIGKLIVGDSREWSGGIGVAIISDYSLAEAKGRLESDSGVLRIWKRLKGSQEKKGMNVVNEDRK
jgi:hypothetical protein